jgi:hypothetical protein
MLHGQSIQIQTQRQDKIQSQRQNYGRHYLATLRDRRWRHKVLHPYYEEMESHHPEIQIKIKNETISFQTFIRFVFITYNLQLTTYNSSDNDAIARTQAII